VCDKRSPRLLPLLDVHVTVAITAPSHACIYDRVVAETAVMFRFTLPYYQAVMITANGTRARDGRNVPEVIISCNACMIWDLATSRLQS
jgi:hypothetical protein